MFNLFVSSLYFFSFVESYGSDKLIFHVHFVGARLSQIWLWGRLQSFDS
jgi:hypothetical protein